MRISDWSSDVCSSDVAGGVACCSKSWIETTIPNWPRCSSIGSSPARRRGSKPAHASHPRLADRRLLRGGVDRNNYHHPDAARPRVASCTEAGNETEATSSCDGCFHVASSAGASLETKGKEAGMGRECPYV